MATGGTFTAPGSASSPSAIYTSTMISGGSDTPCTEFTLQNEDATQTNRVAIALYNQAGTLLHNNTALYLAGGSAVTLRNPGGGIGKITVVSTVAGAIILSGGASAWG